MRRILLAALALLLLAMPVHAQEAAEPDVTFGAENLEQALDEQTREALSDASPTSAGDFGKELWHIVSSAISGAGLALRPALFLPERCLRRRCCARLHPGRRRRTQ